MLLAAASFVCLPPYLSTIKATGDDTHRELAGALDYFGDLWRAATPRRDKLTPRLPGGCWKTKEQEQVHVYLRIAAFSDNLYS